MLENIWRKYKAKQTIPRSDCKRENNRTDRMNKLFSFSNEWMDGKPMKLYTNIQEIDFKKAKAVSMLSPDMIKSQGNHKI